MLQLPHPLLAHYVNFHRALGHSDDLEVHAGRPQEQAHSDSQRNQSPGQFERDAFVTRQSAIDSIALAITHSKGDDQPRDQNREDDRNECYAPEYGVNTAGNSGGAGGNR
jgi:hypothetical protein